MSKPKHPVARAVLAGSAFVGASSFAVGAIHEVKTEDRAFSVEIGGAEIWFDETRAISAAIALGSAVAATGAVIYIHDDRKHG